jgi:HK97 family phage major capsid protein
VNSKLKIKYPHLLATLFILALVITLRVLNAITVQHTVVLLLLGQLAMVSVSRRRAILFTTALSQSQLDEFADIMRGFQGYAGILKELAGTEGGWAVIKKLPELLKTEQRRNDELSARLRTLQKNGFGGSVGSSNIRTIGGVDFIPDDAASALAATFVMEAAKHPKAAEHYFPDASKRLRMIAHARSALGLPAETRGGGVEGTADVPLPTIYVPVIVELVWKYGQFRQYGTVFPLGAGLVKLPRLQAGEDNFGFLGSGTGGQSQNVPQKEVTAALVTFTANKIGGLIRIPTEIEEDTFVPLGQFLARYIARQFAKQEDTTGFLGDGTATYAGITGVCNYCAGTATGSNSGVFTYRQQLAAGSVKPSQAGIADFRAMRTLVNPAVYGEDPAYYLHPSMEALLVTFNTIGSPLIYRPQNGTQPATLDGFPIRWTAVMQAYSQVAAPSTFIGCFGALRYWYLGERGSPRVEISRDVFFATDELAMRALERIDVEAMAVDAMSVLQTAAQ